MEQGLAHSVSIRWSLDFILESGNEIPSKTHDHPSFQLLLKESAIAADLYLTFITKVWKVVESVRILFQSFSAHQQEILGAFVEDEHPSPLETTLYANKIMFVLEKVESRMESMMEAMNGSINSVQRTWKSSMKNLKSIGTYFYKHKVELPPDPLTRNFLWFFWHQINQNMMAETLPGSTVQSNFES